MRRSVLILSVLVLVLGACGGGGPDPQENPQAALTSAFDSLTEAEGITLVATFESDVASLQAMSEGSLKQDDAQKILDSSVTITGRNETDPKKSQSEMSLDLAGIDQAVEFKVLGSTLYLRAAVRDIMEAFGADPADADRFVQDGKQAGFTWAEPAVEGEWLEISGLDELGQQFGAPSMEETARQQREMLKKLSAVIEQNTQTEPGDKEGPGDHLIVTMNIRDLYQSFVDLAKDVGGAAVASGGMPPADQIPDETISLDVWIEDDFVRQMEFDFVQLAKFEEADMPEGVERAALRIALEEFDGEVEAPEETTKVDTQQLMGIFGGMMGGATGAGGGDQPATTDICEQLKGAPPEVIEQFAEECPELQPN
jgi:hypothetical protein